MEIDYRRIGRRLRAAREHNKLTQAQVAEIIGVAEAALAIWREVSKNSA